MRVFRSHGQPSPEHWSKDFVEHLRTVHFALVVVSVGLIVLLSSEQYDATSAVEQLNTLKNLQGLWSNRYFSGVGGLLGNDEAPDSIEFSAQYQATVRLKGPKGNIEDKRLKLPLSPPNAFLCTSHGYVHESSTSDPELSTTPPDNVKGFAYWWNNLNKHPMIIDHIYLIGRKGAVLEGIEIPTVKMKGEIELLGFDSEKSSSQPNVTTILMGNCETDAAKFVALGVIVSSEVGYVGFKVPSITRMVIRQSTLSQNFNLTVGDFDEVFPDLAKASRNRQTVGLSTLLAKLESESTKGTEVFDAFGIKLPTEHVTRWGIILLVGVQLYFVMYLKRLALKLSPDDAGWDTPWMAMDDSLMARVLLVISVTIIPFVAAAFVLLRTESPWFRGGFTWHIIRIFKSLDWPNRAEFVLMPIAVLTSFVLSGLAWHHRPLLTEPVAPSQLFE